MRKKIDESRKNRRKTKAQSKSGEAKRADKLKARKDAWAIGEMGATAITTGNSEEEAREGVPNQNPNRK